MDTFKQVGKTLRKNKQDTQLNSRRIAENFPQVESKVDNIIFDKSFKMEFMLSDHPHSVKLNLYLRSPVNCFQCHLGNPVDQTQAVARTYTNMTVDGITHPIIMGSFVTNIGGFILDPAGGIIVPRTGYYNFNVQADIEGLTGSMAAAVIAEVRLNGQIIVNRIWSVGKGTLPVPAGVFHINPNLYGLCMLANEGDNIALWLGAGAIGFFGADPNSSVTATLIALA